MSIPNWLYLSQTAGTSGTTTITVSAGTNNSAFKLTGLTVNNGVKNQLVTFIHNESNLSVSPTSFNYLPASGCTIILSISSDTEWTITYPWFIRGTVSGTGNQTVSMVVDENAYPNEYRTEHIKVSTASKQIKIPVEQQATIYSNPYDGADMYSGDPLTMVFSQRGELDVQCVSGYYSVGLYYKVNNSSWQSVSIGTGQTETFSINAGDIYYFTINGYAGQKLRILSTANYTLRGNIMSLVYYYPFFSQYDLTKFNGTGTTFEEMFSGNWTLQDAKYLVMPATTLNKNCYKNMFKNCSSMKAAPALPASTLVEGCYMGMYSGCTVLNTAHSLATDLSATNCLTDWTSGVQTSSGKFVKDSGTSWPSGTSGIPNNWTVIDI